MVELGFKHLSSNAGTFTYKDRDSTLVLVMVYVDDTLFCGPNKALVAKLKAQFMKKLECRDLGNCR